jgi:hypothetical protein
MKEFQAKMKEFQEKMQHELEAKSATIQKVWRGLSSQSQNKK